jgi:hypothetical protein
LELSNGEAIEATICDHDAEDRATLQEHGIPNCAARKAVSVGIEKLEERPPDGSFIELTKNETLRIAQLYKVPAIEAGIVDKTRFDTASEERQLFVESTLLPQMNAISDAIQYQLVDRWFSFQSVDDSDFDSKSASGAIAKSVNQAIERRPTSNYVVLIDPDTLPIMARVKAAMISVAKNFRDALDLSANETAAYFGLDIEARPEREDVWVNSNRVNISKPEMNNKIHGRGGAQQQGQPPKTENGRPPKEEPEKWMLPRSSARKLLKRLRDLSLDACKSGEMWALADAGFDGEAEAALACVAYQRVCGMLGDEDSVREWFNAAKPWSDTWKT